MELMTLTPGELLYCEECTKELNGDNADDVYVIDGYPYCSDCKGKLA